MALSCRKPVSRDPSCPNADWLSGPVPPVRKRNSWVTYLEAAEKRGTAVEGSGLPQCLHTSKPLSLVFMQNGQFINVTPVTPPDCEEWWPLGVRSDKRGFLRPDEDLNRLLDPILYVVGILKTGR